MEKSDIVNLIKFHYSRNDEAFYDQAFRIAKDFEENGDEVIARLIHTLMTPNFNFVPQESNFDNRLELLNSTMKNPLYLPKQLSVDIDGVINSIQKKNGISKFLFVGQPGTGKTEATKFIANSLNRKLYSVNLSSLIDSGLGQTLKNIQNVFSLIGNVYNLNECIFLFDELDLIALDRINSSDVREMGRATSLFLKCLDSLPENCILFATTNLEKSLDKALKRRFDYLINFDVYSREDIVDFSEEMIKEYKKDIFSPGELKLLKKLVQSSKLNFSPADLRNVFRISIAFSDQNNKFEYIRRIFCKLFSSDLLNDLEFLKKSLNLSVREIEILTGVSKSTVNRTLKRG